MAPDIFINYIPNFLFILLRTSMFVVLLPFFDNRSFPVQFKIGLALTITLVLTPIVKLQVQENNIPILVIKEIIFGLGLGIGVRTIFWAIELAGDAISNAMGISIATIFNPDTGGQSTIIAKLYNLLIILLFFAMDAHHDLIYIFVKSYELLPVGQVEINNITNEIIGIGSKVFLIGIKIGAPVVVGMMIINVLLGFIHKASPQINIFFVSLPINLFIGFTIMLITTPILFFVLGEHISKIKEIMFKIIMLAKG
jgi:flagellar biosynthetic protein FliR